MWCFFNNKNFPGIVDLSAMIDGRKRKIIKEFGNKLNKARESKGFSLRELSALTGIDHAVIARIELGQSNPTMTTIVDLAEALGIPPGELFP